MFGPLTTEFRRSYHAWSARPFWSALLLGVLAMLAVSGPLACVAHCAFMLEGHHQHHAHHEHDSYHMQGMGVDTTAHPAVFVVNERGDHALCENLMGQSSDTLPSALTVGVVLTTLFMPLLLVMLFQPVTLEPTLRLLALPPPIRPPRTAPSFVF